MTEFTRFGMGTYQLEGKQCVESVRTALEAGYRHVDTAQSYGNEEQVAEGIETSDVDIEDVFIATKLSTRNMAFDDVVQTGKESAERLKVDSIDLMYVHWPIRTYDPDETCRGLNELHDRGVIDQVGVSNFRRDQLERANERLTVPVFAHQVECHPLLPQDELREYARADGHWLVAYCPIARNQVADVEPIQQIAKEHDASPAQVSLAWLLSKDRVAVIPKATGEEHIRENIAARDLELSRAEIRRIDELTHEHRIVDFEDAPWNRVNT